MGKPEEVLPQAVTRKDVSIQKPWFDIPTGRLSVKQAAPTAILTRQHVLILFLEVARARQRAVLQEVVDRPLPMEVKVIIPSVETLVEPQVLVRTEDLLPQAEVAVLCRAARVVVAQAETPMADPLGPAQIQIVAVPALRMATAGAHREVLLTVREIVVSQTSLALLCLPLMLR